MAKFSIQVLPSAERDLSSLYGSIRKRIVARIDTLAENPNPSGAVKLQGEKDMWRVRVGDYRILYTIQNAQLVVLVIKIGHRREVYR
ncbi:MAG TPA: type II toxin-antitoxin system RelE/ParE family toxin [Polyangia bacterium]